MSLAEGDRRRSPRVPGMLLSRSSAAWLGIAVFVALFAACSPENEARTGDVSTGADGLTTDVANNLDTQGETTDINSGPQPGGIGWPCTTPTDCDEPLCLATPDGKRCSTYCGDGACPEGWSCRGHLAGADATAFCVADHGVVCQPCHDDASCQSSGLSGSLCVPYGDDGSFCGAPCTQHTDCPTGMACRAVVGTSGAAGKQCVVPGPTSTTYGNCPCSTAATASGAATTCTVVTGSGPSQKRCKGNRSCGKDGLSTCVVVTGDAASCVQTQCLDPVTQQPLADGSPCEDERACTKGDVCKAGTCTAGPSICPCEPGIADCATDTSDGKNLCRGAPYCAETPDAVTPYSCLPNPAQTKVCDASLDTTCQKNACVPLNGACTPTAIERTVTLCDLPAAAGSDEPGCRVEALPDNAPSAPAIPCDDGLPCSTGDTCAEGSCKPTNTVPCGCQTDTDCTDDGDLCNGVPFCDKSGTTWTCKTNPATIVVCDTSTDDACTQTKCQANDGICKKAGKPDGTACDDGVACTVGDICDGKGSCTSGKWTCCETDADCAKDEDGNLCNGTLFCDKSDGGCKLNPATVVTCPTVDNTACAESQCDKAKGQCALKPVNVGGKCDDGNACSDLDTCDAKGQCKPGKDTCPCKVDADCVQYDDGDFCNGTLYCNPIAGPDGTGRCRPDPTTVVVCKSVDDTTCHKNVCDKKTGVCGFVDAPAQTVCDADGTACTANDACDGKGACVPGTVVCVCQSDADCAAKDDGDLCNGTLYCDKSGKDPACKLNPATVVSCPSVDDTACQKNLCQPKTGQCASTPIPLGAPCDDGEACTAGDSCDGKGACKAGADSACGCKDDAGCAGFDDGDVCNGGYVCKSGACVPDGKPLACDDGDACTDDTCDKAKGCAHTVATGCKACTAVSECDDANDCTLDACAAGACSNAAAAIPCEDGDVCTTGDACKDKACVAGPAKACDDSNACTDDGCDAKTGCTHSANTVPCEDGDACTGPDQCKANVCAAGPVNTCDDGNPCTNDTCDSKTGCANVADDTKPCDTDDSACTVDACSGGKCVTTKSQLWSRTYGGNGVDIAHDVIELGNGDLVFVGQTSSTDLPGGAATAGNDDFWVGRTNGNGDLLWNKAYGGADSDIARDVAALSDGGFVVVGQAQSADLPGGTKAIGGGDAWVVRIDGSGGLLWNKVYGGTSGDGAKQVHSLSGGDLLVVANTASTDLPSGQKSAGQTDTWLLRLDKDGVIQWNKTVGGSHNDSPGQSAVLADGDIVVAGTTNSASLPGGKKTAGGNDIWLVRVDKDGNYLWNQTFGGVKMDYGNGLAVLPDGGFAITGHGESTELPGGEATFGGFDLWIIRTDKDGGLVWSRSYGGKGGEVGAAITAMSDGSLVAAGWAGQSDLPDGQTTSGGHDDWMVHVDAQGNLLGNRALGGSTDDNANTVIELGSGAVLLAGWTKSTNIPGGKKVSLGFDAWLLRTDLAGNPTCIMAGACFGKATTSCDDGKVCTYDSCDSANGKCKYTTAADGVACTDGDVCIAGATCSAGTCSDGKAVSCDDGDPCTTDSCDKASGCKHVALAEMTVCGTGPLKACQSGQCVAPCGAGTETLEVDAGGVKMAACSALGPVWGKRPDKPTGVYSSKSVGSETVVVDSQTKLVWQSDQATEPKSWKDAKTYCADLVLAGEKDWRLPSIHELASIVDYTLPFPGPVDDKSYFPNTAKDRYWSATARIGSSSDVWRVNLGGGAIDSVAPETLHKVRCVRGGGSTQQGSRFSLNAAQTVVTDTWTGLQWQRSPDLTPTTWSTANSTCTGLGLEGGGWRMPTLRELYGLVDLSQESPSTDGTSFPSPSDGKLWTSTGYADSSSDVWHVNFTLGNVYFTATTGTAPVRCVR